MDAIDNQHGAVERRGTRDVNNDYDCNYVDNCGDNDDDDNGRGGSFEMVAGERMTTITTAHQASPPHPR